MDLGNPSAKAFECSPNPDEGGTCDDGRTKSASARATGGRPKAAFPRRPISVRLSAPEVAIVTSAAESHGESPTAFLRRTALDAAGLPVPPLRRERDALAKEIANFLGQLGRIASSANQVARAANTNGVRPSEVAFILNRLNGQISDLRRDILSRAGEERRA